ncbi:MAG: hypothetical protein A2675_02775 [Candidatus Yonathbacteria bacterium RIFCSPHIGHO2_01_FULL_51_10]|uniref:Uncharacterized protein n=1 Tax=Candidatus Yonathbacteria bacterium RIFCSPHIGHO2_01_FULL_51_10 TaxID=1802723 RepID=A0A1G2S7F2_9BACT|nr:MAG: hypothetical protein A2675_02775 [Candidatus Yonathbacteria bacterium RIFCSPHIGHO2_01_FULL_51_10]
MANNTNEIRVQDFQQRVLDLRANFSKGLNQIIDQALKENIPVAIIIADKNGLPNAWGYWGQKNAFDGTPEQLMRVYTWDAISSHPRPFEQVRVMADDLFVPRVLDLQKDTGPTPAINNQ